MNFKQHKNDSTQFNSIARSAYYERQYLMGLLRYDMQEMTNSVTKMTTTRFYEYLIVPVKWYSTQNESSIIQSGQLLEFYYHLSKQVEREIRNNSIEAQKLVDNGLKLMKINFPQMQRINHENLYLYKEMSDRSLDFIDNLIYLIGLAHVVLSIVIFVIFYYEKVFRRKQQVEGYSIYKLIPRKIIEILSNYYYNHAVRIRTKQSLSKYESHFQRQGIYLTTDGSAFIKPNNSTFITNNFKSPLAIWKMTVVLILINVMFAVLLIKVSQLAVPIRKMMNNVNYLMDSQNYLLETYFDVKANIIIDLNYDFNDTYFDELLQSQKSNQVIFNQIAVQSLNLFSNYDESYTTDFIDLLINNTCELAKSQITVEQYQKCKTYFQLNMISNGVIMGMNFFTRKVKQTLMMFKQKYSQQRNKNITKQDKKNMKKVFNQLDFRQIDQSIIFMFKMYQTTQARIYLSLEKTIVNLMQFALAIIIIEVFIIGVCYPIVLILNFKHEKIELSKIYVSFLLIPTPVSKMIKAFAGKIQQVLEVDKNFE